VRDESGEILTEERSEAMHQMLRLLTVERIRSGKEDRNKK